jgi:hypothetical protein
VLTDKVDKMLSSSAVMRKRLVGPGGLRTARLESRQNVQRHTNNRASQHRSDYKKSSQKYSIHINK